MNDWLGKWNYEAFFVGDVDEETKKQYEFAQLKELFGVSKKKPKQKYFKIFIRIVELANEIFEELGFLPLDVSEKQFKLLSEEEFEEKIAKGGDVAGKYHTGYVYMADYDCRITFFHNLTHEIAHLFSFYSFRILKIKERCHIFSQHGYLKVTKGRNFYHGLDEAATELLAYMIRKKISKETSFLNSSDAEELCHRFVYREEITAVNRILLTGFPNYDAAKQLLLKSYIDGSNDFLEAVEKYQPGADKLLRDL